ncbi:MAG: hypothetical protein M3Q08_18540, partial [Pseudomonadota bacterium]|nr:hypothetical protein [Pseudomonadota bacterium]
ESLRAASAPVPLDSAQTLIDAHNTSTTAHADLRTRIAALEATTGAGAATATTKGLILISGTPTDAANPVTYVKEQTDLLLAGKAASVHTHDDRYYTETETNTLLAGKSDTTHTHAAATTTVAGFMAATDKAKLDGVAPGATANATDAQLRDRATHTGTQPAATISDFAAGVQTTGDARYPRYDAAQTLTGAQQTQARSNLGLGDAATKNTGTAAGTVAAGDHGHAASAITNTAAGNISATTVQAAINELDTEKAALSGATFTGNISAPALIASGLTGATAASRYVGATTSGAPTTGTFAVGDYVIDQTAKIWICTTDGTPGTWTQLGGGGSLAVEEADGTPALSGITKIVFDNGTVTNPSAGVARVAGSGGSAADAVTTGLTAAVIPGLAAAPDQSGAAGGSISEEYNTTTTGLTWSPSAPATVNSHTTIKSHLYLNSTDTTERFGYRAWAPAGAFDARTKVLVGQEFEGANDGGGGLLIGNSDNSVRLLVVLGRSGGTRHYTVTAFTYAAAAYTQRGDTWNVGGNDVYLRITRDASGNVAFFWSRNGLLWQRVASLAFSITVAQIGYRIATTAANYHVAADWLRATG